MAGTLEELFERHHDVLKEPYEVVRTVGFEAPSKSGDGATRTFRYRIEVIRLVGKQVFGVILWSAAADSGLADLVWRQNRFPALTFDDPDKALAAILHPVGT